MPCSLGTMADNLTWPMACHHSLLSWLLGFFVYKESSTAPPHPVLHPSLHSASLSKPQHSSSKLYSFSFFLRNILCEIPASKMFTKVAAVLSLVAAVKAHGHVKTIVADGTEYPGGIPFSAPAGAVGWAAGNQDNGFVAPSSFGSADIACHKSAKSVSSAATVAAGGSVTLVWDTWPESHHGPVIDYIAPVDGDFGSASAGSLSFVKLAEAGLNSGSNPGQWASDDLIANGFSWTVDIPSALAPGNYVLRHEILALHSAGNPDGAQAYPQCINIEVTGSGSAKPSGGVPATSFYTASDPGILFNIYASFDSYPIPGPDVWSP